MKLLICLAIGLAACGESESATNPTGKVRILATTGMVADLAKVVGGEHVEVEALMGPGVDPHLYAASAGDIRRLRRADVVLYNGKMLEGKMGDILVKLARSKAVFAVTDAIPDDELLEGGTGHYDPHVWFDVALWSQGCAVVAEALGSVDAKHKADFDANARAYVERLQKLHQEVKQALAAIPKARRVLITSHDAFRYFGRAYDIEVLGLQGISTVSAAGIKDIQVMAELIVKRGIKAIFVETSVNDRAIKAVQRAARANGHEVGIGGTLFSDAMGGTPPEDTYVGMVRSNVKKIVRALK